MFEAGLKRNDNSVFPSLLKNITIKLGGENSSKQQKKVELSFDPGFAWMNLRTTQYYLAYNAKSLSLVYACIFEGFAA